MRDFYGLTYKAGLRPAEALRRAQLVLMAGRPAVGPETPTRSLVDDGTFDGDADTSHPFYWVPYLLTEANDRHRAGSTLKAAGIATARHCAWPRCVAYFPPSSSARERHRVHEVAEHDGELAPFGSIF